MIDNSLLDTLPATLFAGCGITIFTLKLGSKVIKRLKKRSWSGWQRTVFLKAFGPCFGRRWLGPIEEEDDVCGICHDCFDLRSPLQCTVCNFTYHRCCIESWKKCEQVDVQLGPDTVFCPGCRTLVSIRAPSVGERLCSCLFPKITG